MFLSFHMLRCISDVIILIGCDNATRKLLQKIFLKLNQLKYNDLCIMYSKVVILQSPMFKLGR